MVKEPEDIAALGVEFDPTFEACAALQAIERSGFYIEPEILEELLSSTAQLDYAEAWIYISKAQNGRLIRRRRLDRKLDPQHRALPRKERNERQRKKTVAEMREMLKQIRAQKRS